MKTKNFIETNLQFKKISKQNQIQDAITELEREVIRYRSACLSCFTRPIDQQNLTNTQSELRLLKLQLVSL